MSELDAGRTGPRRGAARGGRGAVRRDARGVPAPAALGGAAMLGALAAPPAAGAAVSDVDMLSFGLRFECLQATFYTEAE